MGLGVLVGNLGLSPISVGGGESLESAKGRLQDVASSPFRVSRIPACLGQQALPPRLSPRTQAGPLYPPRLPMQMRPPTGLLPHCAAADIPPQQIRILSGAWVLFFSPSFQICPLIICRQPLSRGPLGTALRAQSKSEVGPVDEPSRPTPTPRPRPSPICVFFFFLSSTGGCLVPSLGLVS